MRELLLCVDVYVYLFFCVATKDVNAQNDFRLSSAKP